MPAKKPKKESRLLRRAEFLRTAASSIRFVAPGFVLQKARETGLHVRYGLTATKKLGNAVARNRARRRLRVLAEKILRVQALPCDYVLVARSGALSLPFAALEADLAKALRVLRCLKRSPAA